MFVQVGVYPEVEFQMVQYGLQGAIPKIAVTTTGVRQRLASDPWKPIESFSAF